jgi:hypothetical protein
VHIALDVNIQNYASATVRHERSVYGQGLKKVRRNGRLGFGQFKDGKPADEAVHKTCFPCHEAYAKGHDFVFTWYAP